MNQLEFSYEDYLHNLTKNCEKMESFNSTLDENCCLDQTSILNRFTIEEDTSSIDNLSSSLSNTISSTNTLSSNTILSNMSSSSNSILPNNPMNSNQTNASTELNSRDNLSNDSKLDLAKQLQNAKSIMESKNSNQEIKIKPATTKVPIKKRKVGVNHKFVNNPKQQTIKKNKQDLFVNSNNYYPQLKLLKTATDYNDTNNSTIFSKSDKSMKSNESSFKTFSPSPQNITSNSSSKGLGCGKPGYITCSICHATKYYSHVQRRFGQFSCEPCSKFLKRFLKDPKVYYCSANGECQIGKPSGEQEPRGVSVNRCKACWLKICLDKFVLDDNTKEVITNHYMPRLQRPDSMNNSTESRSNDARTNDLPPLPLLNTRKRKSNDDALIEKFNQQDGFSKAVSTNLKSKRKIKDDDQTKSDKRERKHRLIYSPPSTPKRNKKRLKSDQFDDQLMINESSNKQSNKKNSSHNLDEFSSSETINRLQVQYNLSTCGRENCNNRQSTATTETMTNCSLNEDQCNQNSLSNEDCGNCNYCTYCLDANKEDDLDLLIEQQDKNDRYSTKSNQLNFDDLSEGCIVDNCSELSYELSTSKADDDYLKDSFYDVSFGSNKCDEELELKCIKNYEKTRSTSKKESTKFKSKTGNKKSKKRKDILTNSNLMRKSLIKKNSLSYIFDATDSNVIFEVLNANSPFL